MSAFFSTQKQTDSRTSIISRIHAKLKKRQHVLLIGDPGCGKSWLLNKVSCELKSANILCLSLGLTRKELALTVAERMHADGFPLDMDLDAGAEPAMVHKALKKLTVEQLVKQIQPHTNKYTFVLEDIDRATERTTKDLIQTFLDGIVFASADLSSQAKIKRVSSVLNHFHRLDVPPLTKTETIAMLWSLVDRGKHKRHRMLETQTWNMSRGVPGVVADIADQLGESGAIKDVRQLHHDAPGVQYVGLLPALLVVGVICLVVFRYASRGFSDQYIYIFAMSGYTILRMMMSPLQRWADG